MARGSKRSHSGKQRRQAGRSDGDERVRGVTKGEVEQRAGATGKGRSGGQRGGGRKRGARKTKSGGRRRKTGGRRKR